MAPTKTESRQAEAKFGKGGHFTVPMLTDALIEAGILSPTQGAELDLLPIKDDLLHYLDRVAYLEQEAASDSLPLSHDSLCAFIRFIAHAQPKERGALVLSPDGYASIEWDSKHGLVLAEFIESKTIRCYCRQQDRYRTEDFDSYDEVVRFICTFGFEGVIF